MTHKNPDEWRAYQREWKRRRDERKRTGQLPSPPTKAVSALTTRNLELLRGEWTACIVRMMTANPCTNPAVWRDGGALYCDEHKPRGCSQRWDGVPVAPGSPPCQ